MEAEADLLLNQLRKGLKEYLVLFGIRRIAG